MAVYIDLVFLVNVLIDGILLWLTAWLGKRRMPWWRMALSSGTGAMYVVMMFVPELGFMYTFVVKAALSLFMIGIAFGFGSLQGFLRQLGYFYLVNFAAAGGIIGIHYLLQSSGDLWNGILYTASGGFSFRLRIGFWFTAGTLLLVLGLFKRLHTARTDRQRLESYIGTVTVEIGEVRISCPGLLDTGNRLCDPLTRTPVLVMEAALWEEHLPASWKGRLSRDGADQLLLESDGQSYVWRDRLRLVPYRGVNRAASFMLALKPDQVTVTMDGQERVTARALIGLDGGTLSAEGAYRAVIHPDLAQPEAGAPAGTGPNFLKEVPR
ncbi:sigma-E processing peptidase SpoIIGA [Paenibacillus glufosinatiresistens]|uniref:sigma-E processing peptidase SpoIIGA n=1 Tax=Paenibacillus glufosinatiresistens TaxID=3070657 RepID=UPI00286E4542|nr:sigma-E processing peptidase SpoIIGA [Paenibacillus sp. YX.27]